MIIELDKKDLAALVSGTLPPYEMMWELSRQQLGDYTGGFSDKWDWKKYRLEMLTEEQLYDIYLRIKQHWNK